MADSWRAVLDRAREAGGPVAVTLEGVPHHAQAGPRKGHVRYWGFTPGINTTYEFPLAPPERGMILVSTTVDDELGEANGEGVDWFTGAGTVRELLHLYIYPAMGAGPYWVSRRTGTPGFYRGGLFAMLQSTGTLEGGAEFSVMDWRFYEPGDAGGGAEPLVGPHGSRMHVDIDV